MAFAHKEIEFLRKDGARLTKWIKQTENVIDVLINTDIKLFNNLVRRHQNMIKAGEEKYFVDDVTKSMIKRLLSTIGKDKIKPFTKLMMLSRQSTF